VEIISRGNKFINQDFISAFPVHSEPARKRSIDYRGERKDARRIERMTTHPDSHNRLLALSRTSAWSVLIGLNGCPRIHTVSGRFATGRMLTRNARESPRDLSEFPAARYWIYVESLRPRREKTAPFPASGVRHIKCGGVRGYSKPATAIRGVQFAAQLAAALSAHCTYAPAAPLSFEKRAACLTKGRTSQYRTALNEASSVPPHSQPDP
jgi:hypothetical protein